MMTKIKNVAVALMTILIITGTVFYAWYSLKGTVCENVAAKETAIKAYEFTQLLYGN